MADPAGPVVRRGPVMRSLRWLAVATVVLYIAVATLAVTSLVSARHTQHALCTLRGDLQQRVAQTQVYLRAHPRGFPGVPAKVIRDGLTNQQRTIRALRTLSC